MQTHGHLPAHFLICIGGILPHPPTWHQLTSVLCQEWKSYWNHSSWHCRTNVAFPTSAHTSQSHHKMAPYLSKNVSCSANCGKIIHLINVQSVLNYHIAIGYLKLSTSTTISTSVLSLIWSDATLLFIYLFASFQPKKVTQCNFCKFSSPHQYRRLLECIQCFSFYKISHFHLISGTGVNVLIKLCNNK